MRPFLHREVGFGDYGERQCLNGDRRPEGCPNHAIAPQAFGGIKIGIGATHGLIKGAGAADRGDPQAHGHLQVVPLGGHHGFGHGVPHPLGGLTRRFRCGAGEHDGEFLAAKTAEDVDVAQMTAKNLANGGQYSIARGMAKRLNPWRKGATKSTCVPTQTLRG